MRCQANSRSCASITRTSRTCGIGAAGQPRARFDDHRRAEVDADDLGGLHRSRQTKGRFRRQLQEYVHRRRGPPARPRGARSRRSAHRPRRRPAPNERRPAPPRLCRDRSWLASIASDSLKRDAWLSALAGHVDRIVSQQRQQTPRRMDMAQKELRAVATSSCPGRSRGRHRSESSMRADRRRADHGRGRRPARRRSRRAARIPEVRRPARRSPAPPAAPIRRCQCGSGNTNTSAAA